MATGAKGGNEPAKKKDKDRKKAVDKAGGSSRDKDKRGAKDKKERSDAQPSTRSTPTPSPSPSLPADPDAVQLFRRYDRSRAGHLSRLDFLALLRDYARPTPWGNTTANDVDAWSHWQRQRQRTPLSLSDASGVPMGYTRADSNSEFEAGQLFERYDTDRTGALSLDKFLAFFRDFERQLRAFAEDAVYSDAPMHSTPPPTTTTAAAPAAAATPPVPTVEPPVPGSLPSTSVRATYQALLWELRKLSRGELSQQRETVAHAMTRMRKDRQSRPSPRAHGPVVDKQWPTLVSWGLWGGENQFLERYETMEADLARMDHILRAVRRQLRRGLDVTLQEAETFVAEGSALLAEAKALVMKEYPHLHPQDVKPDTHATIGPSSQQRQTPSSRPEVATPTPSSRHHAMPAPEQPTSLRSLAEAERLLQVKDQMIYQLLQERATLRKQTASMETSLHELSSLSTQELRKWAQLTDDMQAEIEDLRARLQSQRVYYAS